MISSSPFKNTLEPLVPLITDAFGLHRSNASRNATVFEEHVVQVLGRKLPRSGRARQLMVDQELWTIFHRCFTAYQTGSSRVSVLPLLMGTAVTTRRLARWMMFTSPYSINVESLAQLQGLAD